MVINHIRDLYSEVTDSDRHTSLIFASIRDSAQAPALPVYFRLGWDCLKVTNTLAYRGTELIMAVKKFHVQAPLVSILYVFLRQRRYI